MSGPVVGIIGGGQLARMLAEAASPLGIHVRVLAGAADEGAPEVVPDTVVGAADDPAAVVAFGRSVDVVTFDHENVDHGALADLTRAGVAVWPAVETLRFADKAWQRQRFAGAGIPVPDFVVVDPAGTDGLEAALSTSSSFAAAHPGGVVAKASRGGYDGRARVDARSRSGRPTSSPGGPAHRSCWSRGSPSTMRWRSWWRVVRRER